MGRKCSHCGNNGHNSRTCNSPRSMVMGGGGGGLRLFGVQLYIDSSSSSSSPMKKSFSMDCLPSRYATAATSPSSSSSSSSSLACINEATEKMSSGYVSDGLIMARAQERKKGVPWTEEEHRQFLAGLEKLGKGYWRSISRNFVATRTPTQVASHAQKYFLRQNYCSSSSLNNNKKRTRRTSLFNVGTGEKAAVHATEEPPSYSFDDVKGASDRTAIDLNSSSLERRY